MNDQNALAVIEDAPLTAVAVRAQVQLIQEIMRDVMVEGEHYGTIPGCGDKKTLKQPGAEKLAMAFRMYPTYTIEKENLGGGHREVTVHCVLRSISTDRIVGAGLGSCSTMESKYRYRNVADYEVTEDPIPPDAKERKKEYRRQGFGMKKIDDVWVWVKYTDAAKVENPDIADTWNTVLKMAKKRALVDAVKSTTAASDIFTQDLEDDDETGGEGHPPKSTVPMPQRASASNGSSAPPPAESKKRGPEEVIRIREVREKEDGKGKLWGVYSTDNRFFSTRYGKLADDAMAAAELEAPVRISYSTTPVGGFILDSLEPMPEEPAPAEPAATPAAPAA